MKPKIIAFYLPQYHPTEHNNLWWGKGFTEWTNVAKAKPLFKGHYQPKIPADLGFYDLRLSEIRQQQAVLAKEAGINAFCYYEYWFGEGEEELDMPLREVVNSGEPEFPFCLCWANESWYQKSWNRDGAIVDKKVLALQRYPGDADIKAHFNARLHAFQDHRYLKYNGKLIYIIYKPLDHPNVQGFIELWQELAKEHGLPEFYFLGFSFLADTEGKQILQKGFDGVISCRNNRDKIHNIAWLFRKVKSLILHRPRIYSYKKVWPKLISNLERHDNHYIPVIMPNWDHTPRSGINGDVLKHATPKEFRKHCIDVICSVEKKENPLIFIKSWNEWGEGNYMEPDIKFGHGYINALRDAINSVYNEDYLR